MSPHTKTLARSFAIFAAVYAFLVLPTPGMREVCGEYFRRLAMWALVSPQGPAEITVEPYSAPGGAADTRVVIVNRALIASNGSGPVRNLDLDLGSLGTRSLALLLALIAGTPIAWKRRAQAALIGLLLLHACLFGFLRYCVWAESAELSLVTLGAGAREVASNLKMTLIAQFSVTVPVLVWILVSFRRGDWTLLFSRSQGGDGLHHLGTAGPHDQGPCGVDSRL